MTELIQLQPKDEYNQKLESNVRPPDWVNPTPASRYNLVVIGAGTAGGHYGLQGCTDGMQCIRPYQCPLGCLVRALEERSHQITSRYAAKSAAASKVLASAFEELSRNQLLHFF